MKKRTGMFLIIIGLLMLTAAGTLIVHNNAVDSRAGKAINESITLYNTAIEGKDISAYISDGNTLRTEQTVKIGDSEYIGRIDLIDFDLSFPVMAEWSEKGGKTAPCRYKGSFLTDDLIIAGHNYRCLFGRLFSFYVGTRVRFTDVLGTSATYVVTKIETIGEYDTERMLGGDWDLTLFTCTFSSRSRVTVRCVREN